MTAGITQRPNGSWQARYRDESGREHSKIFPRKVDARAWREAATTSVRDGSHVAPRDGRTTFRTYAEDWRAVQDHRPSTRDQVRRHLINHVYPAIGNRQLATLRPLDIKGLVHGLETTKGLSPSTVTVIYRYVSAILKSAVSNGYLVRTPAVDIKRPGTRARQVVPVSTEDVQRLVAAAPERLRALVILAASTGMRQGELFGLTVDRVDFLRRRVRVDRQMTGLSGKVPAFAPPKTEASVRTIPLPGVALDALAEHLAAYGPGPEGLIFRGRTGQALRRSSFNTTFRALTERAGLDVTFHELRHYYASLLIHGGESVKVVQARLGHASARETLDTYSHLWPESEDTTRVVVDGALGGLSARGNAEHLRNPADRTPSVRGITAGQRPKSG